MKTNKLWFIIAAAAVMTVMAVVSCSKDDSLPEVIESEVLEEGMDAEVVTTQVSGSEKADAGTALSYRSWIVVKGITRAAFENKVSVTLNNFFHNVDTVIVTPSLIVGDYDTKLSYRKRDERQDGFVTITDSVQIYTVDFGSFAFDYELYRETAVYDDGITRRDMPAYSIEDIEDNGYQLEAMDFVIEKDEKGEQLVYVRKLLKHSISVAFNGKSYPLTARVELRKVAGIAPCIVNSELIDGGISDVADNAWHTSYTSWINVRHTWSDGKVSTAKYEMPSLYGEIESELGAYKILPSADVKLESAGFVDASSQETIGLPENGEIVAIKRVYEVRYNLFTLSYPVTVCKAYYDDGIAKFAYPYLDYGDIKSAFELRYVGEYKGDERDYLEYYFTQKISAQFGTAQHQAGEEFQIIVFTED